MAGILKKGNIIDFKIYLLQEWNYPSSRQCSEMQKTRNNLALEREGQTYRGKRFLYFLLEKPDANSWISLILKGSWWPLWRASLTQAHHVLFQRILFNQVIETASEGESYRINGFKYIITNPWWDVTHPFPFPYFHGYLSENKSL